MSNRTRFFLTLWMVFGWCVGSPTPCFADAPVTARGEIELRHATVKLSDLFNGVPTEIDRDIAQAPLPGQQAVYDAKVLAQLADKYRLDWQPQSYADHVTVKSACTRITIEMLRDAVIKRARDSGARGEIDVGFDTRALEIDLPADQPPSFTLSNFDYDPVSKRFRTEFVSDSSQNPVTAPLAGRIFIRLKVPVLAHKLEGGTVIAASDIDWIDVAEEHVNEATITEAKQLIGRELRHTTAEGDVLRVNDVVPPRLVTRGSTVTMKIETSFMSVTTQGRALQDGALGETVRVLNLQSNRMIEGVVDGSGTVVVATASKLASAE